MKKIYLLAFLFLFSFCSIAQIINFPDVVFKNKLLESSSNNFIAQNLSGDYFVIDTNGNNEIEESEALQVVSLNLSGFSISSLGGINFFTNLTSLNCDNNMLSGLNITNLINLTNLDCSNNQLININVNGLTELQNINCQFNQLNNLNVSDITNLSNLDCSYNSLFTLNLNNLLNLSFLNCSNNQLSTIDLFDLISLKTIDCSFNQLISINTNDLVDLENLNCSSNFIGTLTINSLSNFTILDCSNNQLSALNLIGLSSLTDFNCNFNQLPLINLSDLTGLKNFTCTNNQLSSLNLNGLLQLQNLYCQNNLISSIDLTGLSQLVTLNCNSNQLSNIDISALNSLKYFYINYNSLNLLNPNGLNALQVLSCTNNLISVLNLSTNSNLQSVYCDFNQITTLDLSSATSLQNLFCSNNQLSSIFIKNGSFESNLQFSSNPNLMYICADESEIDFVQDAINSNNYTNCSLSSYCTFVPGGISNTIQGVVKYDSNTNGCDNLDSIYPNFQLSFFDGNVTENLIQNTTGSYSKSIVNGSYLITPVVENPNYFSFTPSVATVEFPANASPFNQNFCVTSIGSHSDLEIIMLPLNNAQPGMDANYKIVFKNKGTTTQSGVINLNFNDAVFDLVSSNPTVSSQSINSLNWSFINLAPLELRSVLVTLNLNSATETPSINVGQVLNFTASVNSSLTDEFVSDNTNNLNQIVKNSTETNDKVCVEGNSISSSQIGEYVHYVIRFKNNGNENAMNVVVKDFIDTSKFNINSILPIDGSHLFQTRISNQNVVEFIFENINLSNSNPNNEGFVAFKIKTLPTIAIGSTFSNSATIYFDYKAPLTTNTEFTTIQSLTNQVFESNSNFKVYPNPVKDSLTITSINSLVINSIGIYNSIGQLIRVISNPSDNSIEVFELRSGIYFLKIISEKVTDIIKFIKE
ncbi:T9SS type A sorting domain-containing protein [Flavobacterium sp. SUN052]|uniref:DUF7619 domain-containing protein n=1 Tax=Flavobacterium sp. SUN052 TaxID=3002441 RepID=UPI00237E4140|nr:T9SS type A sorting domain-containing protein [Flavobacterium sp. SUN052]MEC4005497.1 T9SS type A sorting domain-containing protein [Flavobacterium sp. SUN052]